jgi:hypothetical protein
MSQKLVHAATRVIISTTQVVGSPVVSLNFLHAVPSRRRKVLSVLCGLVAAAIALFKNWQLAYPRNFGQFWFAARAVLHGVHPYRLIGPGRARLIAALACVPQTPTLYEVVPFIFRRANFLAGCGARWPEPSGSVVDRRPHAAAAVAR